MSEGMGAAEIVELEQVALPRAKRAFDLVVSASLVVVLAPVWAAAIGAMALDMACCPRDRGRLLYREPRISCGRVFELLKLRTLRESVLLRADGHVRPFEADAENLTWAGRRILKPLYLDELPQLLNVLRGDISLVGPRPWPPQLVERQRARGVDYRLRVPAGWTGPAQVAKGFAVEFEALDRAYVELLETHPAREILRHDVRILRRTLATMLRGEGLRY